MTLKSAIPGRMYTADAVSCDKSAKMRLASVGILVRLIVKKENAEFFYQSVRNSQTDIPVLTCAAARLADGCYRIAIGARLASAVFLRPASPPSDERCVSASCPGTLPRPQGAGAGLRKSAEGGRKR